MNKRRILNGINRSIDQKRGINAAAWFAGQSFNSGTRGDLPLSRLTDKQLNEAGAGLLPSRAVCPVCLGSREVQQQVTDNLTVMAPCAECHGRGYYEEQV